MKKNKKVLSSLTSKARYDYLFRVCAEKYSADTLLFQAEKDTTVGPNGQNEFAAKASNVQLILVEGAKHNILFTENKTFIPYMNTILEFYEKHLNETERDK